MNEPLLRVRSKIAHLSENPERLSQAPAAWRYLPQCAGPHLYLVASPLFAVRVHPRNRHKPISARCCRLKKHASNSSTFHGGGKRRSPVTLAGITPAQSFFERRPTVSGTIGAANVKPSKRRLLTVTISLGIRPQFPLDNVGPDLVGVLGDGDLVGAALSQGESGPDSTAFTMLRRLNLVNQRGCDH